MIQKFDEANRTFETRLNFILELFTNKLSNDEILASSIQYKLGVSYLQYFEDIRQSLLKLESKETLAVMKNVK